MIGVTLIGVTKNHLVGNMRLDNATALLFASLGVLIFGGAIAATCYAIRGGITRE